MDTSTQNTDSENEDDPTPPAQQLVVSDPPRSKKTLLFIIIGIAVLLVGAGLTLFFVFRSESSKTTPPSSNTQAKVYSQANLVASYYGGSQPTYSAVNLNFKTGKSTSTAMEQPNGGWGYYKLPDGSYRYATTENKDNTQALYLQEGDIKSKAYAVNTTDKTLYPGMFSSDGKAYYFYEADFADDTARVATMVQDGTVTTLIDMPLHGAVTSVDILKRSLLLPKALSKDGKVLYMTAHSCIECDGPPYGYLVSYNLDTKKFEVLFADPHATDTNEYGVVTKLGDNYMAITTSGRSNFGPENYAQATDATIKDRLYLYNLQTKKYVTIFESTTDDAYIHLLLNLSSDGKTVYYYTEKAIPFKPVTTSQDYEFVTHVVYGYDIATGKSKAIDFALTGDTYPLFVDQDAEKYVVGVAPRWPVEASSDYKATALVYDAKLATPQQKRQLFASEQAQDVSLEWLGFED